MFQIFTLASAPHIPGTDGHQARENESGHVLLQIYRRSAKIYELLVGISEVSHHPVTSAMHLGHEQSSGKL